MRRSTLAAPATALLLTAAFAQQPKPSHPHTTVAHDTALPLTHVSLYKNGIGFFEHAGRVTGNASVTLDFTTAQLDDVLQSLTAIDLNGGRISGADYNSTTPLEQQLKSLSLRLPAKTTFSGFLNAIRGARVEVRGAGAPFTGRLMDVEMHKTGPGKEANGMTKTRFLSVVSDSGDLRIFPMSPSLSVRLLDAPLHADVNHYLELLNNTHNQGFRHLTIDDRGTGARQLQISYISEVPIWKSTYRVLFTDSGKTATIQGWSVVDNTTGADWINVHLSLIAGAPDSFIQPLSQPLYGRRPQIPIAQQAQLTPQIHDSSIDTNTITNGHIVSDKIVLQSARTMGLAGGSAGGVMGGMADERFVAAAPLAPMEYESAASASIVPATTTAAYDDFFAYNLTDPVTILKNQSALVPILQAKLPADSVTLVSYRLGSVSQPLRALWIKNTTGLTLDRGSFSLVENGNFGGEGLLDAIHPGERRLLSYAADQAIHVATQGDMTTTHLTQISASKGVLNIHRADVHEVTFVIHNASADHRTVVTEVPVVAGWELDSDPKPDETTATVYRFRTEVSPGETVRLHVGGKRNSYTTYHLSQSDDNQLTYILNSTGHNPVLEAALDPILDARRRVADAQTAVDQTTAKLAGLRSDEDRQRANITALQNVDKKSRERFVTDLNKTEDEITAAQTELTTRTAALDAAKADLANRIENLQIDETL